MTIQNRRELLNPDFERIFYYHSSIGLEMYHLSLSTFHGTDYRLKSHLGLWQPAYQRASARH